MTAKRLFTRLFLILLLIIATTLLGAVITATFFQKQIGRRLIAELNKQLTTELTVDGFDLTVLSTFPNVAANLRGVLLKDTGGGALLEAERLAFNFGLLSFLSSEYKVRSVVVSNGALNIHIDRRGRANYEVFKETPEEPETGEFSVSLEQARLQGIELIYDDEAGSQTVLARLEDATFSGAFSSRQFTLNSKAQLTSGFIETGGARYLVGKKVGYRADVMVDLDERVYSFRNFVIDVENNEFALDGRVEQWDDGSTYLDILATNKEGNLEGVLQLLPQQYLDKLGDFSSTGRFAFKAGIKGRLSERENPEIRAELALDNGRIRSPRLTSDLRDVAFTATFTNGEARTNGSTVFAIDGLKGYFDRELIELRLRVENLDDPHIDFRLDGAVPLAAVYKFFGEAAADPRIRGGSGEIEIRRLSLQGRYEDMISTSRISRVEAGGELTFDDAGLTIGEERVLIDRGTLTLAGNQLTLKDLVVDAPGSHLTFNGTAFNVLPVLFADSANSRRAELEFTAELYADRLDIDQLMALSPYAVEKKDAASPQVVDSLTVKQIETRERITNYLKGTFNARIDQFNYDKIEGGNFTGQLEFDNNQLAIRGSTNAMNGVVRLDGRLFFEQRPRLEAKFITEDIDVETFFAQTGNFGQEVLTSRHVSGKLNALMTIAAFWDARGNFLSDDLHVLAGIGINNGELKDFKLLESFSTFVKIRDLKHIRFVNLQEFLEVRNRKIYIPVMFIQSNALNLSVSGEHDFENQFRYNIMVNAGQVLTDRFRSYDPTLQPRPAKQKGFFNLYYTIFGNLDDYEVKAARRLVRDDFERSEQRRRSIRLALENAFGRVDLIEQTDAVWDDAPAGEPEYLDFELQGNGRSGARQ